MVIILLQQFIFFKVDTLFTCLEKDFNAIKIDIDNSSEHAATITTFNEFVKTSVTKYENGDALDNDLNALALYSMILIQPGDNNYGIEANDWDRFKDFVQGDSTPTPTQWNVAEKDVLLSSISGNSFVQTVSSNGGKIAGM